MDKAEYRVMLDRITALADAGDYKGALPIVEEIDWRRVKSARTLCLVSEIYEANGRLEDSLRILEIAYKRASISKTVLYRLSETCAKLGNYKEAISYYREFEEVSPMDNSKYILKYEIYRARGSSLEDQIRVLEEYKEREYTEKWAYELAELYSKAGMTKACVDTCDDMILWFSEGAYVMKALELKKKYVPLTPSQLKKYQEGSIYKAPSVPKWEMQGVSGGEHTTSPKSSVEEVLPEQSIPMESTQSQSVPSIDPARMQSQLADSIRAVFSGINKESEVFEASEMEVEEEMKSYNPAATDMTGYEIKDLEPESVDGISKKAEKPASFAAKQSETDDDQIEGQLSFMDLAQGKSQEIDLEALFAETTSALAQEVTSGAFQMTSDTIETADDIEAAEEEVRKAAEEEAARKAAEEEAARKAAEEEAARKAAEEEVARKAAEEEAARKAAEEEAARKAAEEEAVRKALEEVSREAERESQIYEKETDESLGLTREFNFNEELKKNAEVKKLEEEVEKPAELTVDDIDLDDLKKLLQESVAELTQETVEEKPEEATGTSKAIEEDFELGLNFEEEKRMKYVPVEPRALTEKEKDIFSYFAKIPGMSQQITETICDVHNNAGDKTSKSGNFLIIGRQGSGKTKLYESMVLAICNDLEIEAAKVAKVIGRDLNKKDVAAVVSKLSGGFLVIEGAGELDNETAQKLSQAMEFRTDSLVVVLEDEKADLFAMLDKHPNLSEKFTSSIKIPVFTNDELVTFAKTYASENGYKMDEMGILALYTKIGDNQKNSEPVTVGKVKEIMDEAIEKANRGSRRLGRKFSKNAVDEDNRILLLEKDFD